MKNVGMFDGIWTPEEKAALVSCEVDPLTLGAVRLFEYEDDLGILAYETVTAQLTNAFHNNPSHTADVPPLMQ